MKVTIDFENGMVLTLKPENLQLIDNDGKETVLATRTDNAVIPLLAFKLLVATPAEIKAREENATLKKRVTELAAKEAAIKAQIARDAVAAAANTEL